MQLQQGTTLQGGKYKIVRHLSSGGFDNTYEGYDVSLDKRVAIKEFFVKSFCDRRDGTTTVTITAPAKRDLILHLKQKFMMEARAIAKMEHENIVKVQNLFEENATAYYVMDFIEGESVEAILHRRGSLPEAEALPIVRKVSDALAYMHRRTCYHLDVKPANIMVRRDGKVILINFGSSKQYAEVDGEDTTTFAPCYTPGYAPPEQMNPTHTKFTAATDVYALGATLYKMLTGQKPPTSIMLMMGEAELLPLPSMTSEGVKACVKQAMAPQRTKRLQSIEEFWGIIADGRVEEPKEKKLNDKSKADTISTEVVDTKTQFNLGYKYNQDEGRTQDYTEVMKWYIKATEQDDAFAQNYLGYCYYTGEDIPRDYAEAAKWYRKAAEQGFSFAQNNLGNCYYNGEGVPRDYAEAAKWYRKAAEQGNAWAQNNLGNCYYNGHGVPQNYGEAAKWYRKAAEKGHDEAQNNLGECYKNGEGVVLDYIEAAKWYHKAAERGNAHAQFSIGWCYFIARGVPQDYAEAVKWYHKAAEQGNSDALCKLGECYYYGYGVPQDEVEALKWYRKAAKYGDASMRYDIGERFYYGKGVTQDKSEAVRWYRKAAEQGYADAQCILGYLYRYGQVVPEDGAEAVKWYRKAAEQGDAAAQCILGDLYYYGEVVPKDRAEAVKWYRKAAEQGHGDAIESLMDLDLL